ncbi:MAG TPA: response regulator, partial [Ramlibacter sp.]|nr:response regulator [Ramlibacter sp.]
GVAHDFNNVLQVIGSNLQLLQREVPGGAAPLVNAALGAVERGAKLSAQLLAFARKQPLQPIPFDVNRRISRMDDLLRRSLGERIEIETVLAAGLWTTMADPNQLENVVLNLAINARDAMPGGGRLTIETANCTLDDAYAAVASDVRPGQYVMVAVSDDGTGMPPEVLARVFEPFYTTKPEGQGTGLGLSMAYGFAKQSGGHIRVYSEPGQGTTVKLYLPRTMEQEVATVAPPAQTVVGGSETILVVEDDLAVQASVVRMLQALGYRTLRANDAQAALTVLQSGAKVDLLFTDVVMPGPLRSPELAQLARGIHPRIGVLFTSGYTQNAIVHAGRLDAGVELLSKPYRQEDLARKVRRVLDQAAAATEREAPQAAAGSTQRPTGATQGTAPSTVRVLLVEDQQDLRETTQQLLQMLGAYTVAVACADDAEAALETERYDLLLTDVSLPGRDGIALAVSARQRHPDLYIAFATGYAGAREFPPGLAQSVLAKPYSIEELQQLLLRAHDPQAQV